MLAQNTIIIQDKICTRNNAAKPFFLSHAEEPIQDGRNYYPENIPRQWAFTTDQCSVVSSDFNWHLSYWPDNLAK